MTDLLGRLQAAASVLLAADDERSAPPVHARPGERTTAPGSETGDLLDALVRDVQASVRESRALDRLWLLMSCLSGASPDARTLRATAWQLRRLSAPAAAEHLLAQALPAATRGSGSRLRVVSGAVLVLVDHSARYELQTGVQRVVRTLLPRWDATHDVLPVAHTLGFDGLRTLAPDERQRVLAWEQRPAAEGEDGSDSVFDTSAWDVVVPWRCRLVLIEVPDQRACASLAALAAHSGNVVSAVGHDAIPAVSAGLVSAGQSDRYAHYLTVLAHARRVAGVSRSAAQEVRGFASMLPAQGVTGPDVVAVPLPTDLPSVVTGGRSVAPDDGLPVLLSVGTLNPRKNALALLHAADRLWREGLRFRLVLVAGGAWGSEERAEVSRLRRRRRPVTLVRAISDEDLAATYASARATVFTSLHEGYGLPVAESFAVGVPAVTTSYGSTAEIAEHGGALLVDPRDDDAIADGVRRVLTDDALVARLRAEVAGRPRRSWDDYAAELWTALT